MQTNSHTSTFQPAVGEPSPGEVAPTGYIPLSKLNRYVEPGSRGKRRHPSSFYRYAKRGVLGVHLKTWRFPDAVYTTLEAWYEFIDQLTAAFGPPLDGKKSLPSAAAKRQSSVEAEIEKLRTSIRRKPGRGEGTSAAGNKEVGKVS
jgi:hypothetical protein